MAPPELSLYSSNNSFDGYPRPSPRTRSQSMSSDRPSLNGFGLQSPPASTAPDPAFIATSAASQIVTNDHDSHSDTWFDQHGIEPSGETALVAPPALKLVNRFLDQLLFNFLSISRSTSLASLRPAVAEVLKPKLAKDAINGADQELQEYLGGGEDEELLEFHNGLEPGGDFDLELVWKRTRLRCMVYSSLGDMEEEDEDYYTEQEQLDGPPGSNNRFSNNPGVVSPAVAIFLTSILEFMGEQVLVVAGQAAYHRLRLKHEREDKDGTNTPADIAERVVVEESDMERVALDRTLGRLWRGWKKRIRSPTTSISMGRSFSRESLLQQPFSSRRTSLTPEEYNEDNHVLEAPSLAAVLAEHEHAATIPLPMSTDDVREIDIPGLVVHSDDEEDDAASDDESFQLPTRPKSLQFFAPQVASQLVYLRPNSPTSRKRPNSMPPPAQSAYSSSKKSKLSAELSKGAGESVTDTADEKEEIPKENEPSNDMDVVSDVAEPKSLVVGVVAGALAVGATAVAGITAAVHGEAPQTSVERDEETEGEEEVAQIFTTSRVSIGGRISPDEAAPSRRSSVRSHSVQSVRIIDVAGPKSSPVSRTPSADGRPLSLHSPRVLDSHTPRTASPMSRTMNTSSLTRNGSSLSSKHPRNNAKEPISEEQEKDELESPPMTAVPAELAQAMSGVDFYPSPTSESFESAPSGPVAAEPSRDPISREVSKQAGFVLAAAPPARNAARLAKNNLSKDNQKPLENSNTANTSKPLPVPLDNSAPPPPLTPLREMLEGTASTSNDTVSSNDGHSVTSERAGYGDTSNLSHGQREKALPRPQPNGLRSSPPEPVVRKEYPRKDSSPKTHRPVHTSSSISSFSSHKLKPMRTSEDTDSSGGKGQSFEQLIRSDETIQFTLTPQNMRKIEAPNGQRTGAQPMTVNPHDGPRPMTGRSHSSSLGKVHPRGSPEAKSKSSKQFQPVSRASPNSGARLRQNAPQPRDARVDRESLGDFAEFIKSTGPANIYEPRTAPTSNGHRGTNSLSKNGTDARATVASTLPRRAESSAGRSRLQARDAVVHRGESISDLIDFVRSGPQLEPDSHRIPRTVAPFRSTMDSDQMTGAVGGKAVDASLPDPRYSAAAASVDSSVTSQSALLSNGPKANSRSPVKYNDFDEEEEMMPKRKQRRVRDMYQIDFSDEEEEYEALTSPKPTRPPVQEESLADFLRNVPPPPDSSPAPIYKEASASTKVKKKSSSSGLMSRFGRTNSAPLPPPKSKSNGPERAPGRGTDTSRAPSYTPIAVQYNNTNHKPATYEPSRGNSNYVSQVDSARNKVAQKSYQPRDAVQARTQTSDLASFLRDSGPPIDQATPRPFVTSPQQKDESSTFQRMFGRKKVH